MSQKTTPNQGNRETNTIEEKTENQYDSLKNDRELAFENFIAEFFVYLINYVYSSITCCFWLLWCLFFFNN